MCRMTMCIKAMQRGNAIGKDLGGIIAIALGDVPWMNKNLRFVAGLSLNIIKKLRWWPGPNDVGVPGKKTAYNNIQHRYTYNDDCTL